MTSVDEIADGIYRISTPVPEIPGGFTFNQFLIIDDEPLLFHTGGRRLFPLVSEAVSRVLPVERLRYIAFSHVESDECGSLNQFLAAAPTAVPLCSRVAAMVSISDLADREPRPMAGGETLSLGRHVVEWLDAPHVPHGWETGYLFDRTTATLFSGDVFTMGGADVPPLVESDIVEPTEGFRLGFMQGTGLPDHYGHLADGAPIFDRLASAGATTIANMHGSSWHGNAETASAMIRELGRRVGGRG